MAYIKCPTCLQPNPADAETCSNCGALLHEPIQPGDPPTKKVTSELEPILPEWLREAREKARKSADQDAGEQTKHSNRRGNEPADLLAGLSAQSDDEDDEVPDWLAGITGAKGKKKKPPTASGSRRVEVGGFRDFATSDEEPSKPAPNESQDQQPAWLQDDAAKQEASKNDFDLDDWFKQASSAEQAAKSAPAAEPSQPASFYEEPSSGMAEPAPKEDTLDWLSSLRAEDEEPQKPSQPVEAFNDEQLPDWLRPEIPESTQTGAALELPDWLKTEEAERGTQETQADEPAPSQETVSDDWISQLTSEGPPAEPKGTLPTAGEIELPDWLQNLTTDSAAIETSQAGTQQADQSPAIDWLDEASKEEPAESKATEASEPISLEWLKSLREEPESPAQAKAEAGAALPEANLPDWFVKPTEEAAPSATEVKPAAFEAETPDLFSNTAEEATPAALETAPPAAFEAELPDWFMKPVEEGTPTTSEADQATIFEAELPDWLAKPSDENTATEQPATLENNVPDWSVEAGSEASPTPSSEASNVPDWLSEARSLPATFSEAEAAEPAGLEVDLPDWLQNATPESLHASEEEELPDWLGEAPADAKPATPAEADSAGKTEGLREIPEWAAGLQGNEAPIFEQPSSLEAAELSLSEPETPSAESLDSLFTEVPDWLSETSGSVLPEKAEQLSTPQEAESLEPGTLPSWVQAMRPVEATSPSTSSTGEGVLETKGALAGLHGVLPSIPYPGASSKPKAQSIRMQASQEQQTQADLLEQILLAETRPAPMMVAPRVGAKRSLRIAIGLVLLGVILAAIFTGSQAFPLPTGWPAENMGALKAVEAIPAGSPVLLVFDYEPAVAGEMEAAAAPLLDHMITQNHPRLTIISSSPIGSSLADRLFNGPLRDLQYTDYANLGYLAGGLSGVRSFAQNPAAAMPLNADGVPAWINGASQGIERLSDYSAIILIVDRAETGRAWIEQTKGLYGNASLIVVSSAQAGPMMQPYYQARQLSGLVSGLFDATVIEQNDAGRPGLARKYWDAYNLALIVAILFIGAGSLWNLFAGIRERMSEEAS